MTVIPGKWTIPQTVLMVAAANMLMATAALAQTADQYAASGPTITTEMECFFSASQMMGVMKMKPNDEADWLIGVDASGALYVNRLQTIKEDNNDPPIKDGRGSISAKNFILTGTVGESGTQNNLAMIQMAASMITPVMNARPHSRYAIVDFNAARVSFADWDEVKKVFIPGGYDVDCSAKGE